MNAPTQAAHLAPVVQARPVPQAFVDALKARFGDNCSTALVVREQHGRDESAFAPVPPPTAVVFAECTQDVADAVKLASEYQVPVIPFGVGSSLEGHLLAVQGGISIDLTRMNKVLSINAEDLTVTVQPGVTRKQLNEEIKSTGLFFPIDPGADATLGGMSATRASGTNAVRYGTMRENVLALEVVTASGEVIRTGTRAKNPAPDTISHACLWAAKARWACSLKSRFACIPCQRLFLRPSVHFPALPRQFKPSFKSFRWAFPLHALS